MWCTLINMKGCYFTLTILGFLRIGEIPVSNMTSSTSIITREYVCLENDSTGNGHVNLVIHRSKTDQKRKGTTIIIPSTLGDICPVHCMEAYLEVRPGTVGPVFLHCSRKPVTVPFFICTTKVASSGKMVSPCA